MTHQIRVLPHKSHSTLFTNGLQYRGDEKEATTAHSGYCRACGSPSERMFCNLDCATTWADARLAHLEHLDILRMFKGFQTKSMQANETDREFMRRKNQLRHKRRAGCNRDYPNDKQS